MENVINQQTVVTSETLREHADELETASRLMHSSAYVPAYQAMKLFRHQARHAALSTERFPSVAIVPGAADELIAQLRKFAETVVEPASGSMSRAATLLEQLSAGPAQ